MNAKACAPVYIHLSVNKVYIKAPRLSVCLSAHTSPPSLCSSWSPSHVSQSRALVSPVSRAHWMLTRSSFMFLETPDLQRFLVSSPQEAFSLFELFSRLSSTSQVLGHLTVLWRGSAFCAHFVSWSAAWDSMRVETGKISSLPHTQWRMSIWDYPDVWWSRL